MDDNNRNFFLAIGLSIAVLLGWQFFYAGPMMEQEQARKDRAQSTQQVGGQASGQVGGQQAAPAQGQVGQGQVGQGQGDPGTVGQGAAGDQSLTPRPQSSAQVNPAGAGAPALGPRSREGVLTLSQRLAIDTPRVRGSIALRGGRIDDVVLKDYRDTVSKTSPNVVLFSPAGAPQPFYAEYGFATDPGANIKVPGADTIWQVEKGGPLAPGKPVTLAWNNGEGLTFRRTIAIDANYMFTITEQVQNTTDKPAVVYPYGLISRHGLPKTSGFFILHEGLIGVMGAEGLQEINYSGVIEDGKSVFKEQTGWLGITDKYWAAVLVPPQNAPFQAQFSGLDRGGQQLFQTDFLGQAMVIAPGAVGETTSKLFAGAKEVDIIDGYGETLGIDKFDLLIDWGWFYFITKPLFFLLDYCYKQIGNFGVSIIIVTLLIKLLFFPLANKSYAAMGKMKKLQPEMEKLKEVHGKDKVRMQKEMMELYKREKVNPLSGCLPILVQIPVFFALYKVLFVTIEMRHQPFFGWIQDLSAMDPTSIFNLFGLLPYTVPAFLLIGVWPVLMGITMFVQMKLNPPPTDPIQQTIFTWMPLLFTFLLASFPAGLVIYWTVNNFLSIVQQWVIMNRQGVEVRLWENIGITKLWSRGASKT